MTLAEAMQEYANAKSTVRAAEVRRASAERDYGLVCCGETERYRQILADEIEAESAAKKAESDAARALADAVLSEEVKSR